ncbi:YdcF family protein [Paramicrobacterium agarici]|uniref:YdcF family protein n=1 Tax=Paramicrobacterium agarici TaxID=630514 RepID=UPI001153C47D|nr:ElyC/SanA/YdcF family protein [Microbacterium agarici]TQO22740.1 DUF218 domain-containing protein [Microbacterium agarici]
MRALRVLGIALPLAAAGSILACAELLHWRASTRQLGDADVRGTTEAVVVLGYKNRASRANIINRSRVRAGIRSIDPRASRSVLVLCGGPVADSTPEAEIMAHYARQRGYSGPMRLDVESRSTRQNIENAIPLVEDADRIKVVSDSMHAEFGRAFLAERRPDLAARLVRGEDYRLGENLLIKPIAVVIALRNRRRLAAPRPV